MAGSSRRPSSTANAKLASRGVAASVSAGPARSAPPSLEPPASRRASATTAPTAAMSTGRTPAGRPAGGRRSASATTARAPTAPAATSATLAGVTSPCERAGATGTFARCAISATAPMPRARPATTPGSTAESASASRNAPCCESVAPRWPSRAQLGPHVAPQRAGGQAGEGEQQHGGRPADQQDAARRRATGRARLRERVIRRREAELGIGCGEARFCAAFRGQQAVDVPHVCVPGIEGGRPAVAARKQAQRRYRCETAHARRDQDRLGWQAGVRPLRRESARTEGRERRERPAADDVEPDAGLIHAPERPAAHLHDLAASGRAAARQPAAAQMHVAADPAHRRELDETRSESHIGQLERARERLAGERRGLALRAAVERRVAAGRDLAGPGDAQGALGGRQRRQRVAQRQILRDGAAAGHADEKPHGDRHARADQQRTPRACAQPPSRDCQHGGRATPPRAPVRAGSAVRGGGGLVHFGRRREG